MFVLAPYTTVQRPKSSTQQQQQREDVEYATANDSQTALRSAVIFPCSFTHPPYAKVEKVFWTMDPKKDKDLATHEEYRGRVKYSADIHNDCTLTLTEVFVEIPDPVMEGSDVNLSCRSHCGRRGNSGVIWGRNGEHLPAGPTSDLVLLKVSTEDEGNYSCALKGHEEHPSKPSKLNVMCEILEGSLVTLTCVGDANPPVENYTWYISHGRAVPLTAGSGTYSIANISSEESGYYVCQGENHHGVRNSTVIHLDVYYAPKNTAVSVSHSGEIEEGSSVSLTCSSDANPAVDTYTWYRRTARGSSHVGSGESHSIPHVSYGQHAGHYHCEARNAYGLSRSPGVELWVRPPVRIFLWLTAARGVAVGSVALMTLLLVACVLYRRKERTSVPTHVQADADHVYEDVSASPVTPDLAQGEGAETGGTSQTWVVKLAVDTICAVTGSSVVLPCSFTHPPGRNVTNVFWLINPVRGVEPPDLLHNPAYSGRIQYSADIENNCTLVLSELTIEMNGPVVEGQDAELTCSVRCTVANKPSVIWKKNGDTLPTNQMHNNTKLSLKGVRPEDEGLYSCQLKDHEGDPSKPVKLDVMFPPKNTTVAILPANGITKGDSVTLTCSCNANPPVEKYTWFKVNKSTPVGSGQQYTISNITSEDGGQYYCEARNKYGAETSFAVFITVKGSKVFMRYVVIGLSTVCGLMGVLCVACLIRFQCGAESTEDTSHSKLDKMKGSASDDMDNGDTVTNPAYQNFKPNESDDRSDDIYQNYDAEIYENI
ncbi:hypothetical protein ACEWY4_017258 [Coilia grayii]|uniref:Ig-like domain-containing protein n=1 Tax=Coilia grayii TaxID=363190 RepID=A0ABD1JHE4_9TELE